MRSLRLLLLIIIVIGIILRPWGTVIATIIALYILGTLIGNKIVIDRVTESITVEKRPFLLIHKHRVIPFSRVTPGGVTVEEKYKPGVIGSVVWNVCLAFDVQGLEVEKLRIAGSKNEREMRYLADEVSRLIGK